MDKDSRDSRMMFRVPKLLYDQCSASAKENSQTLAGWVRLAMKEKLEREESKKNSINDIAYVLNNGSPDSAESNLVKDSELIKKIYNYLIDQKIEELKKAKK